MGLISKEDFLDWVPNQNWLIVNELATPKGRNVVYLTPSGEFIIAQYNLKGDLENIGKPPTSMPMPMPMPMPPGLDLRGGGQRP